MDGLLTLAKLDSHTLEFHREDVEAKELTELAAEPLRAMLQQKQVDLEILSKGQGEQEVWLSADMPVDSGGSVEYFEETVWSILLKTVRFV